MDDWGWGDMSKQRSAIYKLLTKSDHKTAWLMPVMACIRGRRHWRWVPLSTRCSWRNRLYFM